MDIIIAIGFHTTAFMLLMGVLLTVHEWGHYYAARIIGVSASDFAIGIGPTIWSHQDHDGCTWHIKLLPIGGYVKFHGGKGSERNERERFDTRSPGDRAFVIAAGPALNLLFGMILIASLYAINGKPYIPPVISGVESGTPADIAGIQPGDEIISINGMRTTDFADIVDEVSLHPLGELDILILRDGKELEISVTAQQTSVDTMGRQQTVGRIGIQASNEIEYHPVEVSEALMIGAEDVYKLTRGSVIAISQIMSGQRSIQEMGGPVRIAEMSGAALGIDFRMFILLMAVISINLGVMNLLPIPILDGGQLIICIVESIQGRPVGNRALAYMHQVSALFLILFIIGMTFNDMVNLMIKI